MNDARHATTLSWATLGRTLDGRFTARASGLLVPRFALLDPDGREFGRLEPRGVSAELSLRGGAAKIQASEGRYRMSGPDGEEVLAAVPRGNTAGGLGIHCGGRGYVARTDLLRNRAVALEEERGTEAARLSGGALFGRGYRAVFDAGDGCTLPVAVFLLWFIASNRRRSYRRPSSLPGGGAM